MIQESRVAHHAALALSLICDCIAQPPQSAFLQPYYELLLEKLFNCAEKTGTADNQLRENAAYALISVINCRTPDTEGLLVNFYNFVIQKCNSTLVGVSLGVSSIEYNHRQY